MDSWEGISFSTTILIVTPSQLSSLHAVRIRDLFFVARGNVFHAAELLWERFEKFVVFVRVSLPERFYSQFVAALSPTEKRPLQSKTRIPEEMDSKENSDAHQDTGIWLTFASKEEEHVTEQETTRDTSKSSTEEAVASTEPEVSYFPVISSEIASSDPKGVEISPSFAKNIVERDTVRPRTLTSKGREFHCGLKKKTALARDRDFREKLKSSEELIQDGRILVELRKEGMRMVKELGEVMQCFDDWIELAGDNSERQHAANKQAYLLETSKTIHATALQKIKTLEEDTRSVCSQRSQSSRSSARSRSSANSRKETLIECRAKRAALEEKLKFSAAIAEQEIKLEQLKIQKEMGEIAAQEAVYKDALDEGNELDDVQQPLLPTKPHDVMSTFLNSNDVAGLTSTPEAPNITGPSQEISSEKNVMVTSSPPFIFTEPQLQSEPPASHTTLSQAPLVQPAQENQNTMYSSPQVNTMTSFSVWGQTPPVHITQTRHPPPAPKGFCGNAPAFTPLPTTM